MEQEGQPGLGAGAGSQASLATVEVSQVLLHGLASVEGVTRAPAPGEQFQRYGTHQDVIQGIEFQIMTPDPAFSFDVTHEGNDAEGDPFTRGRLTLGLEIIGFPGSLSGRPRGLPIETTLVLPFTEPGGSQGLKRVQGGLVGGSSRGYSLVIDLVGTTLVLLCFRQLREIFDAQIHLSMAAAGMQLTLAIGNTYASVPYLDRYRLVSGGTSSQLVDEQQIRGRAPTAKAAQELASLGNVRDDYASFSRVYYDSFSNTVVLVPSAYGFYYDSDGLAVGCDALVDLDGPLSDEALVQFRFTLSPIISQVDYSRIEHAIEAAPEVHGKTLHLRLPGGLDMRYPHQVPLPVAAEQSFAEDFGGPNVLMSVLLRGGAEFSAVNKANRFLTTLSRANEGLFGSLSLRVGPSVDEQVTCNIFLDFRRTSSFGAPKDKADVTWELSETGKFRISNKASQSVLIERIGVRSPNGEVESHHVRRSVAASESAELQDVNVNAASQVLIDRRLDVKLPLPAADLSSYISFNVATEYSSRSVLAIDASSVDFAFVNANELIVVVSIIGADGLHVPSVKLTESHRVEQMTITVPMQVAIVGLVSRVVITLRHAEGERRIDLQHDFSDRPLFLSNKVLSPSS